MDIYKCRYLLLWFVAMLVGVTGLVLLTWGVYALVPHSSAAHAHGAHTEQGVVLASIGAVAFLLFVYMRRPRQQLRYRSGMDFCSGLFGRGTDSSPSSMQGVLTVVDHMRSSGLRPTVVGGAWSNVLRRQTARGPRLFTRNLVGEVPGSKGRMWYAGTEVMDVNKILAKRGQHLISVPSYGCVTMGAWVATMGHGMTSAGATHGLVSVRAQVLDMASGVVTKDDSPEMLLDKFGKGTRRASQFLVLTVDVGDSPTLRKDALALREGRWIASAEDAAWALQPTAAMMVLFVGRRNTLCLRWTPQPPGAPAVRGGGALMDTGIALFATLGRGLSNPAGKGRDRSERLSAGITLFHFYLHPIFIWVFLLLGITNFEVYTSDVAITPKLILSLTQAMQPVHRMYGGRTEVRVLGKLLFVDCFAYGRASHRAMLTVISAHGIARVALHPGKYAVHSDDISSAGLQLAVPYEVARSQAAALGTQIT